VALIRCDFFSDALELSTSMTVILPQATKAQIGMRGVVTETGRHPTLYLLHGLSDDDSTWVRRTSIERYVAELGLAVVMPQVHRSFYADEVHGGQYWTFLSEELPEIAASFFPVSDRREDTFVAGLSMGGYGAYKWALNQPERFAAAASLSGVLDIAALRRNSESVGPPGLLERVFGDREVAGTPDDLLWLLADRASASTPLPALYLACGTEDELIGFNRTFVEAADAVDVPLTASLGPGEHDWDYWDATIQDVLRWLPLTGAESAS
jgi:putative tributyrin esterase